MPTPQEKADFSERLKFSMTRAPEKMRGATDLALHFNLRYRGESVSPQTAHKWLTARSIPTADKLKTLSEWFKVDQHWLHYGPPPSGSPKGPPKPLARDEKYPASGETLELATKIESLSPHHRYLLEELIEQFYGSMKR
ncbi:MULTISPECIES: transcriptional regulator [unclassified Caballeronia]|uniref:transcriptional regulator n=1 Tax=unclassified Caballeronia TaxID=2646786 RepID=UPI00285C6EE0|nr:MULTISPECIES: transcriptional regulator [unclassified Caballeronia]MDR5815007.1 transcriptional regulator [Caballeronia sp. LZ033]MDR5835356.1 transcriptional regulator [Caballeronia sp. LZ034LL]